MQDLKTQLLKAGLVSQKQAKQAQHLERQKRKQQGTAAQEEAQRQKEEAKAQLEAEKAHHKAQNAAQNAAREEAAKVAAQKQKRQTALQQALAAELALWQGSRSYYFADGTQIYCLEVNEPTAEKLSLGQAAIIRRGESPPHSHVVVTASAAQALTQLLPQQVACWHKA